MGQPAPTLERLEPRVLLSAAVEGSVFVDINANGRLDPYQSTLPTVTLAAIGPVVTDLNHIDDGSTAALNLGFTFDFFGQQFTQFYINNNGNITFQLENLQHFPDAFPQARPMIAAFWEDVDTTPVTSGVVRMATGVSSRGQPYVQIDWDRVGYFDAHVNKLNTFSIYLENDPLGDILALKYGALAWTTGDKSGGVAGFGGEGALLGFDAADGVNFLSLGRPKTNTDLNAFRNQQFTFRISPDAQPRTVEPGLVGATVFADVNHNAQLDGGEPFTQTLAENPGTPGVFEEGTFHLDNVPPGEVPIRVIPPAGHVPTSPVGFLRHVESIANNGQDSAGNTIVGLNGATAVAISPDGLRAYSAAFDDNRLLVWTRDPFTGKLVKLDLETDAVNGVNGLNTASDVVVSPDNQGVYVAGRGDNAIAVFRHDPAGVVFVQAQINGINDGHGRIVTDMLTPIALAGSPDGQFLYAVTDASNSVVAFQRNPVNQTLTFIEALNNGDKDYLNTTIAGLTDTQDLAISPDGLHVAISSATTLTMFSRDLVTGKLHQLQTLTVGPGSPITSLNALRGLSFSPDGAHLYIAASTSMGVFSRNVATGLLTFVTSIVNAQTDGHGNTATGLLGGFDVRVSPNGHRVYVSGETSDAIAVFERNPVAGDLRFLEVLVQGAKDGFGAAAVAGLDGVRGLAMSGDSQFLYAAGRVSDTLTTFDQQETRFARTLRLQDGSTVTGVMFGEQRIGAGAELMATSLNLADDFLPNAGGLLTLSIANQGPAAAGAFSVRVVYSLDNQIGNADDVTVNTLAYAGLAALSTNTQTVFVQIPKAGIYAQALAADPTGMGAGYVSRHRGRLGVIVDSGGTVPEALETNNASQANHQDSDDVAWLPWDIDHDGKVSALDAIFAINRINKVLAPADAPADFNGDGVVNSTEATAALARLGYVRDAALSDTADPRLTLFPLSETYEAAAPSAAALLALAAALPLPLAPWIALAPLPLASTDADADVIAQLLGP